MAGMPERKVKGGMLPAGMAPSGGVSSRTPTARERVTDAIRRTLFSDDRAGQDRAERVLGVADATGVTLPLDAYEVAREAASGRPGTAGMMLGMAMLPGSARGMGFMRTPVEPKMKAYHISPYEFDQFRWDADVRGTGEGAQVYGDGLYFAESPKVSGLGGHYWHQFLERIPFGPEKVAANWRRQPGINFNRQAAADYGQALLDRSRLEGEGEGDFGADYVARMNERWQKAIDLLRGNRPLPPYGYEVDLKMRPDNLIQWDKPMSQQPKPVLRLADAFNYDTTPSQITQEQFLQGVRDKLAMQRADNLAVNSKEYDELIANPLINFFRSDGKPVNWNLYKAWRDAMDQLKLVQDPFTVEGVWRGDRQRTGEDFYSHLANNYNTSKVVQPIARDHDVHGTMFLDGNSRSGKNSPTHNFAIWTPELINITRKFAIPGALGLGMLQAQTDPNRETQ